MTDIRACRRDDLAAVARLYRAVFRPSAHAEAVESYLRGLLFDDPWRDVELCSQVAVAGDGQVTGFIGVLPGRMRFAGRELRVASAGSLMVDPTANDPMAGARLVRAFLGGPQDLSLTESANRASEPMWKAQGGVPLPGYSADWFLPLRPAGFALALAAHWTAAARLLNPLAAVVDRVLERRRKEVPARAAPVEIEATPELLCQALPALTAGLAVVPAFTPEALAFRLAHAAAKDGWGPFHARLVMRGNQTVGCYVYYAPRGAIGRVLQLLAVPAQTAAVLSALVAHARGQGCVGLRGRAEPAHLDAVLRRGAVLASRSSTLVRTADTALLAALRSGDAWLTGLACESWTRLIGDPFRRQPVDSGFLKPDAGLARLPRRIW